MRKKSFIFIVSLIIYSVIYGNTNPLAAHGSLYQEEMDLIHKKRIFIPPAENEPDFTAYRHYIHFLKAADAIDAKSFDDSDDKEPTKVICQQKIMALLRECYVPKRYAFYTNVIYVMNESRNVHKFFLKKRNGSEVEIQSMILTTCNAIANQLNKIIPGDRYQLIKSARHIMQTLNGIQYYSASELVQFLMEETERATDIIFGEKRCTFVEGFQNILSMSICHRIRKGFTGNYAKTLEITKEITEHVLRIKDPESRMRIVRGACFVMKNLRAKHKLYSVPQLIDRLSVHEPYMDRFLAVISHLFEAKKPRNFLELDHIYTLCAIDITLLEQIVKELDGLLDQFSPTEYSTVIHSMHKKDLKEIKNIINYSFYISKVLIFVSNQTFYYRFIVDKLSQYELYQDLFDKIEDRLAEYKSDCCHLFSWVMPNYIKEKRNKLRQDLSRILEPAFPKTRLNYQE